MISRRISRYNCFCAVALDINNCYVSTKCDIPWYKAFPRNTFIINVSMYFGATEKWHVQMVMVSRVVQLAGASDAPSGTRVSYRPVYAVISVMPDV